MAKIWCCQMWFNLTYIPQVERYIVTQKWKIDCVYESHTNSSFCWEHIPRSIHYMFTRISGMEVRTPYGLKKISHNNKTY